jgi:hypothetical protein
MDLVKLCRKKWDLICRNKSQETLFQLQVCTATDKVRERLSGYVLLRLLENLHCYVQIDLNEFN